MATLNFTRIRTTQKNLDALRFLFLRYVLKRLVSSPPRCPCMKIGARKKRHKSNAIVLAPLLSPPVPCPPFAPFFSSVPSFLLFLRPPKGVCDKGGKKEREKKRYFCGVWRFFISTNNEGDKEWIFLCLNQGEEVDSYRTRKVCDDTKSCWLLQGGLQETWGILESFGY